MARFRNVLAVLAVLAGTAHAQHRRFRCGEAIAVAGEPFRRSVFLLELAATTFFDANGAPFWFEPSAPDGRLVLDVRHSLYGPISDGHDGNRFTGFLVGSDGSIDGEDANVDYGRHQHRGYLSALFAFLRVKLPDGVELTLVDISATHYVGLRLYEVSDEILARFAAAGDGAKLYAMYRRLRAALHPLEQLREGADPHAAAGFRNYLADVGTIWGRVARYGNFRRNYRCQRGLPYVSCFRKYPIPESLHDEEDALLATVDVRQLLEDLLPPTAHEQMVARLKARQPR